MKHLLTLIALGVAFLTRGGILEVPKVADASLHSAKSNTQSDDEYKCADAFYSATDLFSDVLNSGPVYNVLVAIPSEGCEFKKRGPYLWTPITNLVAQIRNAGLMNDAAVNNEEMLAFWGAYAMRLAVSLNSEEDNIDCTGKGFAVVLTASDNRTTTINSTFILSVINDLNQIIAGYQQASKDCSQLNTIVIGTLGGLALVASAGVCLYVCVKKLIQQGHGAERVNYRIFANSGSSSLTPEFKESSRILSN